MNRLKVINLLFAVMVTGLFTAGLSIPVPTSAATPNISRSYNSSISIQTGSIVSLDQGRPGYVQLSTDSNGSRILGVVVSSSNSLLAVNPIAGETQVATSGDAIALVSTLNGVIHMGDKIAVSQLSGVGMKAQSGSHVIGLALADFSNRSPGSISQVIKDTRGQTHHVIMGYIPMVIAIGTDTTSSGGPELNSLQRLAQSLTGHAIPTTRVVIALLIAIIAFALLISMIYGSIYGSIISIGRNPLAKFVVLRNLASVAGMAAFTAILAILTIYFLLR